jgi:hypothetical protein
MTRLCSSVSRAAQQLKRSDGSSKELGRAKLLKSCSILKANLKGLCCNCLPAGSSSSTSAAAAAAPGAAAAAASAASSSDNSELPPTPLHACAHCARSPVCHGASRHAGCQATAALLTARENCQMLRPLLSPQPALFALLFQLAVCVGVSKFRAWHPLHRQPTPDPSSRRRRSRRRPRQPRPQPQQRLFELLYICGGCCWRCCCCQWFLLLEQLR